MSEPPRPEQIRSIVADVLQDETISSYGLGDPLAAIMDSFAMIELVSVLEEEFDISFQNEDLNEEHWKSFTAIAALAGQKS